MMLEPETYLFLTLCLMQMGAVHVLAIENTTQLQLWAGCLNMYLNCLVLAVFVLQVDTPN